jgi:hypothetical protein
VTELSVHTELLHRRTTDPLAGWLLPSALVVGGVLAAALIGAAFAAPQYGSMSEPAPRELATIISTPPQQSARAVTAIPAAVTQPSFAFGFLEFDWDPNAPGGVPGFDSWPSRELRVAEARARN